MINGLSRLGATVVHKSTALVHVSGHAPAGELRYLINAVRPRNHMPVHGEWRHLRAHAAIARSTGHPRRADHARRGRHGRRPGRRAWPRSSARIPVGYVYVDGLAVGDIGDAALKDRRILGEEGFLSILVAVDLEAGKVVFGPEITARGFTDDPAALDPIRAELITTRRAVGGRRRARRGRARAHRPAHRRPLGRPDLPPPTHAHADGGRGLIPRSESDGFVPFSRGVHRRVGHDG